MATLVLLRTLNLCCLDLATSFSHSTGGTLSHEDVVPVGQPYFQAMIGLSQLVSQSDPSPPIDPLPDDPIQLAESCCAPWMSISKYSLARALSRLGLSFTL